MSLALLLLYLMLIHVSDVNTSILRSLRLMCWVISWVVLIWFDVCWCYVVVWLWWCGIRMQAEALLATYLLSYFMGCIALVRCVLVLSCGLAVVVWYPYAGWSTIRDLFVELFHGLYCSGSMCVGVTLWFGWGGMVSVCRLKPAYGYHTTPAEPQRNTNTHRTRAIQPMK